LSDSYCVGRHREQFLAAVKDGVDIVCADENEIVGLLQAADFGDVLKALADYDNLFVMTRSARGSVIVQGNETVVQEAIPVTKVVDTTGAGDAYTAGFLHGLTSGRTLADCARLGTWCATGVIQQVGPRLEKDALKGFK
ncbi:MAG TPA: PfkB family carbohydrate kinase, partial [Woeseiaceae bacterium]|nr:PfkB family carbohydrate kinase [Woeseiaceae bacterium]